MSIQKGESLLNDIDWNFWLPEARHCINTAYNPEFSRLENITSALALFEQIYGMYYEAPAITYRKHKEMKKVIEFIYGDKNL